MTVKQRLIDGMEGQGILLRTECGDLWLRLSEEHRTQIIERVLKIPGIAFVDLTQNNAYKSWDGTEPWPGQAVLDANKTYEAVRDDLQNGL